MTNQIQAAGAKIVTVTLNPAIDQTVRVDDFAANQVNRAQAMQFDAGGKGVNVASFLVDYGLGVTATGFLGDANVQIFEVLFAVKGIGDRFVHLPGYTRTNVKIVDEAQQQTTDINMRGLTPTKLALQELQETVADLAQTHDWFVLSGMSVYPENKMRGGTLSSRFMLLFRSIAEGSVLITWLRSSGIKSPMQLMNHQVMAADSSESPMSRMQSLRTTSNTS